MTNKEAAKLAHKRLTHKRYEHTKGVAATARALAVRYGASPHKAELAGWLHDIVKQAPQEELLQLMEQDAIMAGLTSRRPYPIWHGPCGAIYAKHYCGVQDEEILSAIACHTTGKPAMALLDKILFTADMISPERDFEGVDALRALAHKDLDAAVIAIMRVNIAYIQSTGRPMDEYAQAALAYMLEETGTSPAYLYNNGGDCLESGYT